MGTDGTCPQYIIRGYNRWEISSNYHFLSFCVVNRSINQELMCENLAVVTGFLSDRTRFQI